MDMAGPLSHRRIPLLMRWDAIAETVRLSNVQRHPLIMRIYPAKYIDAPVVVPIPAVFIDIEQITRPINLIHTFIL